MQNVLPIAPLRRRRILAASMAAGLAGVRPVLAQRPAAPLPWPDHRVRLITPAVPGSSLDIVARAVAERLAERWRQPVIVDGRSGADGIPALEAMLAATPGEALFLGNHGAMTVTPILHPQLRFDPMAEFPPILDLTTDLFAVAVPAALPAASLGELLREARERPGAVHWTAPSGPPQLAMRAFLRDAGAEMTFVGFRGVGSAVIAEMLAGRLQVMLAPLGGLAGALRDGQLRALAVTSATRAAMLPAVPTSTEQGFPAFLQEGIHGLFGWKAMPDALRHRLAADAAAVIADPALAERLRSTGVQPRAGGSPASFAATLVQQRARWTELAREFGPGASR